MLTNHLCLKLNCSPRKELSFVWAYIEGVSREDMATAGLEWTGGGVRISTPGHHIPN